MIRNSGIYLGDHTALTTTKYGQKIYVDTRDTSLAPHILLDGVWEQWVTDVFVERVRTGSFDLFIDVGANFGWYTLVAARLGLTVRAIEPNPRLVSLLRKSIDVNGYSDRVGVIGAACGAAEAECTLIVPDDAFGGGRVSHVSAPRSVPRPETWDPADGMPSFSVYSDSDAVPLRPLSQLINVPFSRGILKVDVESYEVDVLIGAAELLDKIPVILVEHHRANTATLFRLLSRYTLRHIEHTGLLGAELTEATLGEVAESEMILCERKHA